MPIINCVVLWHVVVHRRMEQLESQVPVDRESPATLPITEGSRASSHSSIDALPPSTLTTHHRASSPEEGEVYKTSYNITIDVVPIAILLHSIAIYVSYMKG